jgi:uncharacterized protein (DUF2237 family)
MFFSALLVLAAAADAGQVGLSGKPLQSCTQTGDARVTGWTRSGSCVWAPSDGGYHEVCVSMSDDFLRKSAVHDANDLSSVVGHGGHWCICAWAFASAVSRDPVNLEGITLDCERTNGHLRSVYQKFIAAHADLHSPSGAAYNAQAALDVVNRICPDASQPAAAAARAEPVARAHAARLGTARGEEPLGASAERESAPASRSFGVLIPAAAIAAGALLIGAMRRFS